MKGYDFPLFYTDFYFIHKRGALLRWSRMHIDIYFYKSFDPDGVNIMESIY